ncbi:hypothetical protein Afe04nite_59720 [Asanoa ferruginea]|nr:hypothetical protein Afe04nite_59720 [Asanoa ferruginea]
MVLDSGRNSAIVGASFAGVSEPESESDPLPQPAAAASNAVLSRTRNHLGLMGYPSLEVQASRMHPALAI